MKQRVIIVGGGSAALMLAAHLDETKFQVDIYERNAAAGRKFLVTGDGGLNITHSEPIDDFVSRYTPPAFLEKAIREFSNEDLRSWLNSIGIETYVGTSKRVFPLKSLKPIEVLNAILKVINDKGFSIHTNHLCTRWENKSVTFQHDGKELSEEADIVVFSLGGSSWKVTGSDGSWTQMFEEKGIRVLPFQPSNCAYKVSWNDEVKAVQGQALKNIVISCDDKQRAGELVVTADGLEGGAIYALSPAIRKQLNDKAKATLLIDLKPGLTVTQIRDKFMNRGNRSVRKLLEDRLSFSEVQISILKQILSKEEFTDLEKLADKIKALPVPVIGMADLDEAISTVGGIALREVNENFELVKQIHHFVIGEMLNWDAPTGGYLLQGCFSMGVKVARTLNSKKQA
jgi:uncharacterized flavoprotein (TIGR03862 family)